MQKYRDRFTFYASYYEAIKDLPQKQQNILFHAICVMSLTGDEPPLDRYGSATVQTQSMFKLIKPNIIANRKRFQNGKQGGRPENIEYNNNQNITDGYTKRKTKTKPDIEIENDYKEKEKDNIKDNIDSAVFDKILTTWQIARLDDFKINGVFQVGIVTNQRKALENRGIGGAKTYLQSLGLDLTDDYTVILPKKEEKRSHVWDNMREEMEQIYNAEHAI